MNDPASPRWVDPAGLPSSTIYDPSDDGAPPFASAPAPPVVLLLVGDVDRGWAARTAIELADAWAASGQRVVLADFHLENPVLQSELGGEGLEGVVDLFVYGASMGRCTREVPGREFQFLPTGTYTPDADAIFRHPRWTKLVDGFKRSRATLVVFAPADAADLGPLATWVDEALLLGEPHPLTRIGPLRSAGTEIRGLIVPPRGESATARPPPDEMPASSASPATPAEEAAGEGLLEPELPEELHLPPPPARVPHVGHRAGVLMLWLLLGIALLTAVGYVVGSLRPDLMPWAPSPADSTQATPAPRGSAAPQPLGEQLPYSVRVVAFGSFEEAYDQVVDLHEQVPGVLFYIAPENIQGITYHKVMAGALRDSAAAEALREMLLTTGVLDAEEAAVDWNLIQETRYSLLLGELPTRGAAAAAVDSLLSRQVPAYRVAVPFSDGGLRWYVYAGAFRDSVSAEGLRTQLAAAGLRPRLIPRFGSPASPEL